MESFIIQLEIKADLKLKSDLPDCYNWYLINIEHMMIMIGTENISSISPHNKIYPGPVYALKITNKGLHYYDQNNGTWYLLEERVQRAFSDYVAENELLKDDSII